MDEGVTALAVATSPVAVVSATTRPAEQSKTEDQGKVRYGLRRDRFVVICAASCHVHLKELPEGGP